MAAPSLPYRVGHGFDLHRLGEEAEEGVRGSVIYSHGAEMQLIRRGRGSMIWRWGEGSRITYLCTAVPSPHLPGGVVLNRS